MSAAEEKDLKSIPSNIIKDGDYAFLIYDKRRQWVKKVEKDQTFHCDRGFIEYNKLIGKEFGHKFWLSSGKKIGVLKPTLTEKIFHMKRRSQIIYPEDAALILAYGNVRSGTNILEAGTGSASLTSCLGKYCRPKGTVNTFEVRKVAFKQAKQNIKMMGLEDIVTCNFGDLLEVLDQYSDIDFVSLDLPNTWDVVPNLRKIVSETGRICLFSPVIEQVEKNVQSFRENEFYNIINLEMIKREFQVKPNATRPYGRTVGHSGYLSFATKAEEVPLLTEQFTSLYSPQNIGYLLLYGNIGVDSKLLIFGEQKSPLIEILNHRFGNSLNFEVSLKRESLDSEQKKYDVILIDNKCENQLVNFLEKFLEPGGTVLSIQKYI